MITRKQLHEPMRTDYEVKCYTGATRMQSELDAAFNLVAPRDNWKNSIDTTLPCRDPQCIASVVDAVVHFTGGVPTIHIGRPTDAIRVTAPGYYVSVGA